MKVRFLLALSLFLLFYSCSSPSEQKASTLIQNVLLADGTSNKAYITSVRFRDSLITEIGDLIPLKEDSIVDGSDLILSPGFIDGHSHIEVDSDRYVESAISQGITTVIVGVDGFSKYPLESFFDSLELHPLAVNVASFTGQNVIRTEVMKNNFRREANESEVSQMEQLVHQEMKSGALGLSTALEYAQGPFSSTKEVIALAKVAASYGGVYSTHLRSYDRAFEEAVQEAFQIGREANIPVVFTHLQMGKRDLYGKADRVVQQMDSVRQLGYNITADVYPYIRWSSSLNILVPAGSVTLQDAEYAVDQIVAPENLKFTVFPFDRSIEGKTLAELAAQKLQPPAKVLLDLVLLIRSKADPSKHPGDFMIAQSTIEEDNRVFLAWEYTSISTDGWAGNGHPRSYGAFPKYFSQSKEVPLEERIRKMTSLSAENMGLKGLGIIKPGSYADLVLFDRDELKDRSSWENPKLKSKGIKGVWVNGVLVYTEKGITGALSGRVIRKKKAG